MGLFTVKTKRAWNQDQTIETEIQTSNIDEDLKTKDLEPKFLKSGVDVTKKIMLKAHYGLINISKINKAILNSDFKMETGE